ncbi:MAG: SsrA-binding protein [Candidatus Moranbacteria bacterium CG10_big_fil_rev_8_21_14_0_10_35_21]|nr:MAG: SsrA-binding protein [Candidatus Moranbacteria bacterium CG10_big_fil_rev_8_21_14_0_10_35_21]PJA88476.1 MAG: SsrA-binding protein [Candidatus Moranbacteria bacterium CG_4_9_14_3_um_filter_36_9]
MATLAINRRAHYDYSISQKYEAGLVLSGNEVKSIKTGHISLKESFVTIKGNELYLTNANIPFYHLGGKMKDYDPTRPRKLLLKKSEIKHLTGKLRVEGLTLVPIRVYTKKRLLKLEFGIGKGKKEYDKREDIAKRESKRKIERLLKNY